VLLLVQPWVRKIAMEAIANEEEAGTQIDLIGLI